MFGRTRNNGIQPTGTPQANALTTEQQQQQLARYVPIAQGQLQGGSPALPVPPLQPSGPHLFLGSTPWAQQATIPGQAMAMGGYMPAVPAVCYGAQQVFYPQVGAAWNQPAQPYAPVAPQYRMDSETMYRMASQAIHNYAAQNAHRQQPDAELDQMARQIYALPPNLAGLGWAQTLQRDAVNGAVFYMKGMKAQYAQAIQAREQANQAQAQAADEARMAERRAADAKLKAEVDALFQGAGGRAARGSRARAEAGSGLRNKAKEDPQLAEFLRLHDEKHAAPRGPTASRDAGAGIDVARRKGPTSAE